MRVYRSWIVLLGLALSAGCCGLALAINPDPSDFFVIGFPLATAGFLAGLCLPGRPAARR